ncbi:MAG: DUF4339 domain-containing protein [Bacteroidales bacterium]|nr:DUF4339 domain-containing protein [Bacteroidales bacterium]MBP5241057.1 DUF4339 domain-containing protein [Bacteroidales bacterium]
MENTQYFCYINGQQYGPVGINDIKAYHLNRDTLVWREGLENWVPAGTLSELSVLFAPAPPPAPATVAAAPLYTPAPASAPRATQVAPRRKTFAKTAKVFGIWGIIASVLMQIPSWVMLVERDRYWYGYDYWDYSYGVDQEWGLYFLLLSLILLAFSIVTVASASRTIRRNKAQR